MLSKIRKNLGIVCLLLAVLILNGCTSNDSTTTNTETLSDKVLQINRQNGNQMFSFNDEIYLVSDFEGPLSIYQLSGENNLEAVLTFPENYSEAYESQCLLSDDYIYMLIEDTAESTNNLIQINMEDGEWKILDSGWFEQIDLVNETLFYLKDEDSGCLFYRKEGESDAAEIVTIDLDRISSMVRIEDRFYITGYQYSDYETYCVDLNGNILGDDALLTKIQELDISSFYVYGTDLIYCKIHSGVQSGVDVYLMDLNTLESQKIYTIDFGITRISMDDDHVYLLGRQDTSSYHLLRIDKDGSKAIEYTGPIEYYAGQPLMTYLYNLNGEVYLLKTIGGTLSGYDETYNVNLYRLDDDGLVHLYGKEFYIDE